MIIIFPYLKSSKSISSVLGSNPRAFINVTISFEEINDASSKRHCRINDNHSIGIITWKETIDSIKSKIDSSKEQNVISDINQLAGLCEKLDSVSFIPLDEGEINSSVARRNIDYCNLVDEIVDFGKEKKLFSTKGLNKGAKKYIYHRYFRCHDWNCKISFDNYNWYNYENTPIWLEIYGRGDKEWNDVQVYNKIKKSLKLLETTNPKQMINNFSAAPLFPIYLKENKTKSDLIENACNQITVILNHLKA